jgi:nucleoid-associated protein YgaU
MRTRFILSFLLATVLAVLPLGAVLAHGEPVIAVEPAIVAAGGQITITGTEMEPGEVFAITLEGMAGSIALGEAIVTGEGEEGGFSATFIIPAETAPGSYTVTATAEDGDTTVADLTITAPSEEASAEPAMAQEPTGELHQIDRSKPLGQVITVVVVIALSAAVGFVLIRNRG